MSYQLDYKLNNFFFYLFFEVSTIYIRARTHRQTHIHGRVERAPCKEIFYFKKLLNNFYNVVEPFIAL